MLVFFDIRPTALDLTQHDSTYDTDAVVQRLHGILTERLSRLTFGSLYFSLILSLNFLIFSN